MTPRLLEIRRTRVNQSGFYLHTVFFFFWDAYSRMVGRRELQGATGEAFPVEAVAAPGGVHHAAQHGAVTLNPGHGDPHQPILAPARHREEVVTGIS